MFYYLCKVIRYVSTPPRLLHIIIVARSSSSSDREDRAMLGFVAEGSSVLSTR
jgi:hypothetical protein